MTRFAVVVGLLVLLPSAALGQTSDAATTDSLSASDSLFLEAQRLVAAGQGDSGRAIVQKQLDAATPGTPAYVDALYWHAVVAPTAADAEHDLRTIVVTYPASRRSADALLRLAQLELARGENDQALQHLQRIIVEHPDSPDRGRAEFWTARTLLDRGDLRVGCARLADASRLSQPAQVELQNQIAYLQRRCLDVDTSAVAPVARATHAAGAPATSPASEPAHTAASAHASAPARRAEYTIQTAAYSTKAAAERLRDALVKRGYDARVVGQSSPFRVRVGRYATRAAAETVAGRMRAQQLSAYVTTAESP